MRRVVITGFGIVSSLGNNNKEVLDSLINGKSGIEHCQDYADRGFRSHIHGKVNVDTSALIGRKLLRFMGDASAYAYLSMKEAIEQSDLNLEMVSSPRTGLIVGIGGSSMNHILQTLRLFEEKGPKKVGPYMVPRTMASTNAANLATAFKIRGLSYTISSACATSSHCIGNGVELIQMDKQDIVFAGGGEEICWLSTLMFDAMGALSSKYNDTPQTASRAYDESRDGFVISGGGGMVVLEELEHAKARGATIYGEVIGYGATSDGADMVAPSGEGAIRCMKFAMNGMEEKVDYINTHGTSTPAGDITELDSIKEVFGTQVPSISSTKSLSGHALGSAGVHEAIYSLLMINHDFICASANITNLDPGADGFPIITERVDQAGLNVVMSNSFGFGGTNATLILKKYSG